MNKVFVVVLNYNHAADTLACIKSLQKLKISPAKTTKYFKFQIIVVDNKSKDVAKLKGKFHLIKNKSNWGYVGGNNVGVKYALKNGADYIIILNNDTEVDPLLVSELIKVASSSEKIGIVCPKIYFAKGYEYHKERYSKADLGKVIWWAGGRIDWKNIETKHVGVNEVDIGQYNTKREVGNANGSCMLVKKEVFEKIGHLDERYYLYWEETDFAQKARRAGFKIYFAPKALVWHKVAATSEIGGDLHDYFLVRNRLLFATLNAPFRSRLTMLKWGMRMWLRGRPWQKTGARDFFIGRFGKGSWKG